MSYHVLAEFYDALLLDVDYEALLSYYESIWEKEQWKPSMILDLACGTGNLIPCLEQRGYDVIGVDLSPEMLECAREKCGPKTLLLCQNICELDLYGTIDAALCSLDSMNSLLTEDEVVAALAKVHLFLMPGGIFIFDINSSYKIKEILCGNTYTYDTEAVYCVWESFLDEMEPLVDFELTFFAKGENGLYQRHEETITERLYEVEEMKQLVARSGFTLLGVYGDKTFDPPAAEEERLFFICRKEIQ